MPISRYLVTLLLCAITQVVLLGDTNTGKTCLVLRFVDGSYKPASRTSTIGAFFLTKRVTVNNITCKVLIWDTAGQEKFQKLTVTYYQNAAAAIICYDVSNPHGLARLRKNLEELERYKQNKPMVLVVAACKRDLPAVDLRMEEEAQKLAASYDALYMETSAKANRGVAELFHRTAATVLERHEAALQGQDRPLPVTVGDAARDRLSPAASRRRPMSPSPVVEGAAPLRAPHHPAAVMETKDKMADEESCTENESDEVVDDADSTANRKSGPPPMTCEGSYLVCGVDDAGRDSCVIL
jgi:small GTP-binding protein